MRPGVSTDDALPAAHAGYPGNRVAPAPRSGNLRDYLRPSVHRHASGFALTEWVKITAGGDPSHCRAWLNRTRIGKHEPGRVVEIRH